jgi:hypothetical protein
MVSVISVIVCAHTPQQDCPWQVDGLWFSRDRRAGPGGSCADVGVRPTTNYVTNF